MKNKWTHAVPTRVVQRSTVIEKHFQNKVAAGENTNAESAPLTKSVLNTGLAQKCSTVSQ